MAQIAPRFSNYLLVPAIHSASLLIPSDSIVLVTFLVAVIKHCDQDNFQKEGGSYSGSQSQRAENHRQVGVAAIRQEQGAERSHLNHIYEAEREDRKSREAVQSQAHLECCAPSKAAQTGLPT